MNKSYIVTGNSTQDKITNAESQGFTFTKSDNGYRVELPALDSVEAMTLGRVLSARTILEHVAKQIWGSTMQYEFRIIPNHLAITFRLGVGVDYNTAISNL